MESSLIIDDYDISCGSLITFSAMASFVCR